MDLFSLKENRGLIAAVVFVPVFMFYLDEAVMKWIREFHLVHPDIGRFLQSADIGMYFAAHGTTMIAGAVIIYLFGRYINGKLGDMPKSILAGLVASGISVQIIKHLIGRARPRVSDSLLIIGPTLRGSYDSFPSGHTAMAFCLAHILSNNYPAFRILFYIFAVCEGLARIDGTSHFPSDVLAGAIVGIIIAKIAESKISVRDHKCEGLGES
jgi:membrane-associated phospholipid phosphatase